MSDDLAVLDSPVLDAGVDDVQQVSDDGVDLQADPAAQVQADVVKDEVAVDWRKVPAELKELFKTPAGKAAKDAWFERQAFKEVLPEGVKQAKELLGFLDEHGGREGLTTALGELQGKATELDAISEKIANADPSLVKDLPDESVSKLGPVMNDRWQQADPEGWSAAMSGVFAATISNAGIPQFLDKMSLLLEFGKIEDATKMAGQLKEWAGSFASKAQAPRTSPVQQADKFTAREQALNQREAQTYNAETTKEVEASRLSQIEKEIESFVKRAPGDNDKKELAVSTIRDRVLKQLNGDKDFVSKVEALHARRDKAGALKLIKSRESLIMPTIAQSVGRLVYGNPGPVKVAPAVTGAPSKVDAGYALTDKPPAPHLIDRSRTSDADIMRGKFILKDGRKLTLEG